jgi:DNA repair photolyase
MGYDEGRRPLNFRRSATLYNPTHMAPQGRGSTINPTNRFQRIAVEDDFEHLEQDEESLGEPRRVKTEYYADDSISILSENDSPDVFFRYSINPYRGCAHGCSYCYARPSHEYLGLSAGLDFEAKIFVKERAPALFRDALASPSWSPEPIMLSGVTDCYQPAEQRFRLTRGCLEVALEAKQPMCIITKNALVTRDLDLLAEMASRRLVSVALSVTTLDAKLAREMEPRTSSPAARLRAMAELSAAGVPTTVMVAPVIPGLNDTEIPAILAEAKGQGASSARFVLLRLPLTVRPVFLDWLERTHPTKKQMIEGRIRATRDGKLNESSFGKRMRGTGEIADQIGRTFEVFARRFGLDRGNLELDTTQFRPPRTATGQLSLF